MKLIPRLSACLLAFAASPVFAGPQDSLKDSLLSLFQKKKITVVLSVADTCPMVYENIATFNNLHKKLAAENKDAQFIMAIDRNPDQYKKKHKVAENIDVIQAPKSFFNEHKITNANELLIFDQEGKILTVDGVRQHYKGTSQENWTSLAKNVGIKSASGPTWIMDWKTLPVKTDPMMGCELRLAPAHTQQNNLNVTNREPGLNPRATRFIYN